MADNVNDARRLASLVSRGKRLGISDESLHIIAADYGLDELDARLTVLEQKEKGNKVASTRIKNRPFSSDSDEPLPDAKKKPTTPKVDLPDNAVENAVRVLRISDELFQAMEAVLSEQQLIELLDRAMYNSGRGDILDSATHPFWGTRG